MAKQWYTATFRDQPLPTWHAFRTSLIAEFKGEDKAKIAREKLAKMVQAGHHSQVHFVLPLDTGETFLTLRTVRLIMLFAVG
jgi:hypothetical protein